MKIKVSKKFLTSTIALTLSCAFPATHTFASEIQDDEKQLIEINDRNSVLALPSDNTIFSLPGHLFGVQEELALYNKSQAAIDFISSEDFRSALNNLFTWAAYNESKHLYQQHGDKFIAPLADTLINTNFALAKSLLLKTTGLSDVVKAVGILTGDDFSLPKKPSAYIRENSSQSVFDICRLKFLTDTLNEKVIAPHIIAPCIAYTVHKADIAGIIQQHIVSKIQVFLEEQKPALEKKANLRLEEIESDINSYRLKIATLKKNIENWEELPETVEIQHLLGQTKIELEAAQREQQTQQKIVDDECAEMSTTTYYLNYLPFTSTENQKVLKGLKQNTQELLSAEADLTKKRQTIKTNLEYEIGYTQKQKRSLKEEKNTIIKGLKGENIRSRTIGLTSAFATGFLNSDEKNLSEEHSVFETAFAGMSWVEMIQPCPHINYQYLQWIESQFCENDAQPQAETSTSPFAQTFIETTTQMGTLYLESTGFTKAATNLQCQLSQKNLEKNKKRLFEIYEKDKETSAQNAQLRADILEDNDASGFAKAAHIGGLYFQDIKNTVFKYGHMSFFVAAHANLLKENVISLGSALRTAARPLTVGYHAMKYTAPVWAISYMTSYAFDVSMPYGTGLIVPLALGIMDDFNLWESASTHVTNTKSSLNTRFTYARAS